MVAITETKSFVCHLGPSIQRRFGYETIVIVFLCSLSKADSNSIFTSLNQVL